MRLDVAPGFSLNLEVTGGGPPLVLLHGFTGSAAGWGEFGDLLARQFTLVAIDIVGHGRSDAPARLDHYRMPAVVEDLVTAAGKAGFPRASWLGYSMGGRTALHIAAAHPGSVDRLVLIGASPGIADPGERAARIEADEALARRIEEMGVEPFVDYWEALPVFRTQERLPAEVRAQVRSGRLASSATGLANSLRGMGAGAQEPLDAKLAGLPVPTLLIAGDEDAKYTAIGAAMAEAMPCARFRGVPGAGHAAQLEAPRDCAKVITEFLLEGSP